MPTASPTPQLIQAAETACAALDHAEHGLVTGPVAVELFNAVEHLNRLAAVARVDAIAAVEHSKVHRLHGHSTAHAMARHLGRISPAETARADKIRRMTRDCDHLNTTWRAAHMSLDQASLLARAYSNPRVRERFVAQQQRFANWLTLPLRQFERKIANWVNLNDHDGPEPRPDPAHHNRDITLTQDHFSRQWTLRGTLGSLQGAELRRILDAYTSTERLTDWETAQQTHRDQTCRDHLARTDPQHRADALAQIFNDAITNPQRSAAIDTCHNIIWSQQSFEHELRRFAQHPNPEPVDIDQHRCETLDGHPLHPATAFADTLVSNWRTIVVTANRISLDATAKQRFYTGLARLGIQINHHTCFWPGCDLPPTQCQVDHRKPAARGRQTTQHNGAPACQTHNRQKERGYTITRQPNGTIHITTPTGELLPT